MTRWTRREFLKAVGISGTAAAMGCSSEPRRLIPYIVPPEDLVPGEATWYATTCRECPAGCGMLAKNRDGRIIKVEGNPNHPVNQGKLCARGQASLQGLYNPDRFRGPLQRTARGSFDPISWEQADGLFTQKISQILREGKKARIVFVSELITGTIKDLIIRWLSQMGAGELILYEPFSYEPLRKANQIVFGIDAIPTYRIDRSDFLISFGAPFLETWLSNVEYARQFAGFRALKESGKNLFFYVGPRFSMTAANADEWIPTAPGTEYLVAIGMLKVIQDESLAPRLLNQNALKSMMDPFSLDEISKIAGVSLQRLRNIARRFAAAKNPLALSEGVTFFNSNALSAAVAADILCSVVPGTREAIDFERVSSYGDVTAPKRMKRLTEEMAAGGVDLLLISGVNPVYSLPGSWNFDKALQKVPFIVTFSSYRDETSSMAHLVMPAHTFLESWGDYSPQKGITGFLQPTMGHFFDTRQIADILISAARKTPEMKAFAWETAFQLFRDAWRRSSQKTGPDFETYWQEVLKRGGDWGASVTERSALSSKASTFSFPGLPVAVSDQFNLLSFPTLQFFDGRMANRLWIQELPDPITQATWGGWIEIHEETARRLNISAGDLLRIQSPHGFVDAPALPFFTVPRNVLAIPMGQGHTRFSPYADGLPANPMNLYPPEIDDSSEGIAGPSFTVTLQKLQGKFPIAHTDGSYYQYGRGIAQTVPLKEYQNAIRNRETPKIRLPMAGGFQKPIDFYPPHHHDQYRWGMVVDLDRCIGCGACVVACYAENNVAVVGRSEVLHQREMSWIRVQRYFELKKGTRIRYLPMLCQHCDEAPCESVCPVFAPNHSREGINNQVYNRCIGTRDCSQNCPYKVRRFNFFSWKNPDPLPWQYNPDVTVREKGVMEKCSFCIQRVVQAKIIAGNEGRLVGDGEFTSACAQTCPTGALTFGNLKDPNSRVSKLVQEPRAYQVFYELNTKPGVIYLKKVLQEVDV